MAKSITIRRATGGYIINIFREYPAHEELVFATIEDALMFVIRNLEQEYSGQAVIVIRESGKE